MEDQYGNLWVGTRYHGLFHYSRQSGKILIFNAKNSELFNENNGPIESLFIDSNNRIRIGLTGQLIVGSISKDGNIHILDRKNIEQVRMIKEDNYGNIWIGSWNGLLQIENKKLLFSKVQNYYRSNVPDMCILDSGDILFSSYGEGIFRLAKGDSIPQMINIQGKAALVAQACVPLYGDSQHRIWMGSCGKGMLCGAKDRYLVVATKAGLRKQSG